MDAAARAALLAWYRARRRDLPWRRSRDPYAVWVSEAMLQQTRVETVVPYYLRWMARFPTVSALAAADGEEALAAWSGLGYYRRARHLHEAARRVVAQHAGKVPGTVEELRALPGVGAYTAGAVASIAFGQAVPCVDGNVVRVAARVLGLRGVVDARVRRRIEAEAARWVDAAAPGDWNQALMELGATVCTPRDPACPACPVAVACRARALGIQDRVPRLPAKAAARLQRVHFAVVEKGGRVLLVRSPDGLLGGLWALPGGDAAEGLEGLVASQAGRRVRIGDEAARLRHAFTHRTWDMRLHRADDLGPARGGGRGRWVAWRELRGLALSTAMRRALEAAAAPRQDDEGPPLLVAP